MRKFGSGVGIMLSVVATQRIEALLLLHYYYYYYFRKNKNEKQRNGLIGEKQEFEGTVWKLDGGRENVWSIIYVSLQR